MLKLNLIKRRNPLDREASPKYYATAVHGEHVGVDELAKAISSRCSLRESDVHGVIIALMGILPEEICKGNIVSLGKLGSFYVNVSSEGVDSSEDVSSSMVRGLKIIHQPTKELKKQLRMIDVSVQTVSQVPLENKR